MSSSDPEFVQTALQARRRVGKRRGFTLVEVMVATGLLTMVGLGILSVMIGAYRVAAKARYRDHARYVIKSLADQFLTQQPADQNTSVLYPMFVVTEDTNGNAMAVGSGISWTNTDGTQGIPSTDPNTAFYYVLIGDNTGTPIKAAVTRSVSYIDSLGNATLVTQAQSAGYLLEGDFTISYPYLGQTISQTITAIRAIP